MQRRSRFSICRTNMPNESKQLFLLRSLHSHAIIFDRSPLLHCNFQKRCFKINKLVSVRVKWFVEIRSQNAWCGIRISLLFYTTNALKILHWQTNVSKTHLGRTYVRLSVIERIRFELNRNCVEFILRYRVEWHLLIQRCFYSRLNLE